MCLASLASATFYVLLRQNDSKKTVSVWFVADSSNSCLRSRTKMCKYLLVGCCENDGVLHVVKHVRFHLDSVVPLHLPPVRCHLTESNVMHVQWYLCSLQTKVWPLLQRVNPNLLSMYNPRENNNPAVAESRLWCIDVCPLPLLFKSPTTNALVLLNRRCPLSLN